MLIPAALLLAVPTANAAPKKKKPAPTTSGAGSAPRRPGVRVGNKPLRGGLGPAVKLPRYRIAVQFVRTADDDGAAPSTLTKIKAQAALKKLNEVWARNGGDIRFHLHSDSNFNDVINSTLLNQDCTYTKGWDANKVVQQTDPSLDPASMCSKTEHNIARSAYGLARANRVVVFSRGGNEYVKYDKGKGHWKIALSSGGASSSNSYHIRMPRSFAGSTLLAHEMGHYMHAAHTFKSKPSDVQQARSKIEAWAASHPDADPMAVFDGDSRGSWPVYDTPPDAGTGIFKNTHGKICDVGKSTVVIPDVMIKGKKRSFVLAPDRANVMSYFKGCPFPHHLSTGQWIQIHAALKTGNRKALVAPDPGNCYDAARQPGPPIDTQAKLIDLMRNIAKCVILQKEPMPWETTARDIYVNPVGRLPRTMRKIDGVGVNVGAERRLVKEIVATPMVQ